MRCHPILAVGTIIGALHLSGAAVAEPVSVDLVERHPNGAHLRITSIDRSDNEVLLGVRIVNGHSHNISLNSAPKRSYIRAGDAAKIMLVPPDGNSQVKVPARSTVEGDLVFMGAIPEGEELTLVLNENGGTSDSTPIPKFVIELPVQVMGASAPAPDAAEGISDAKKN